MNLEQTGIWFHTDGLPAKEAAALVQRARIWGILVR
jgi:hypothetical protein